MGTWGDGNLENDGTQDTLAEICDALFARVIELLQHPRAHEYDDEEIDELFVRIEMIFALHGRGMINSAPAPEILEPLFPPYLAKWSAYWTTAARQEPPEGRRRIIERSFEELLEITRGARGGSFAHRTGLILEKMSGEQAPRKTDEDDLSLPS